MLEETKKIIKNALTNNDRRTNYLSVYAFTNENIKDYLKGVEGNIALAICSSGDQYLNLIHQNFNHIDLIDTNPLTEYYALGIKKALILGLTYEEYLKAIKILLKDNDNLDLERKILNYLLNFMEPKYRLFWQEIFAYYFSLQKLYQRKITLLQILTQDYYFDLTEIKFLNTYLYKKENYDLVRKNLKRTILSFTLGDILNFDSEEKYDLILCSNIMEYIYDPNLDIKKLHKLFANLLTLLNKDGLIYANYIYGLYQDQELRTFPIGGANITGRELLKEEIKLVPSARGEDQNGVLILRRTCN